MSDAVKFPMCIAAGLAIVKAEGSVQRYIRAKEVEVILQRAHDANEAAHMRIDDLERALKECEKAMTPENSELFGEGKNEPAETIKPLEQEPDIEGHIYKAEKFDGDYT